MTTRTGLALRAGRNSLWATLEYLWYPALLFLSTRFLLRELGEHGYGTWMFLNAIVASTSILNVGLTGAVIKVVSAELGRGADVAQINRLANGALGVALIAGVATAATMLVVILLGWRGVASSHFELFTTAGVAVALIFIDHADAGFSSMLKGGEHFSKTAKVEVVFKTIQILVALGVATWFASLPLMFIALVATNLVRMFAKLRQLKRAYGLARVKPSLETLGLFMPYAKWGWLHGIGGFLLSVVDRLVVGATLGAEQLASYSLLLMFPQQIHAMISAAVSVTFPRISSLLAAGDAAAIAVATRWASLAAIGLAALMTVTFLLLSSRLFPLWLGHPLPEHVMSALTPLTWAFFLLCANVVPYYTLLGLGQVRFVASLNLIAGIASVGVLFWLLRSHGLIGAAVSKIVYGCVLFAQFFAVRAYLRRFAHQEARG